MKALISQIRFMIKDAWKSRYRRSHVDWDQTRAMRESTRPGMSRQGMGLSARGNTYEMVTEANDRYIESFEKKT